MIAALKEMYEEPSRMMARELEEHSDCWIDAGDDDGKDKYYVLTIGRHGNACLSIAQDQDDDPETELSMSEVSQEKALNLWKLLHAGEIEKLLAENWEKP